MFSCHLIRACPLLCTACTHALLHFFFSLASPSPNSFAFTVAPTAKYPPTLVLYSSRSLLLSFYQPAPPIPTLVEGPLLLPAINQLWTGEHGGERKGEERKDGRRGEGMQKSRRERERGIRDGWSQEESSWARLTGNDNDLRNLLFAPQQ